MKRSIKVALTFSLAFAFLITTTVIVYSYPVILMGGTLFQIGGIPGGEETFEVIIPWPNTQIHVIVEVTDLIYLNVPGAFTGIKISNLGHEIASIPVTETDDYDLGWIDAQSTCNITLRVYGYLTRSVMAGRITVWGRSPIHVLLYGDFLIVNDHIQH